MLRSGESSSKAQIGKSVGPRRPNVECWDGMLKTCHGWSHKIATISCLAISNMLVMVDVSNLKAFMYQQEN